MTIGLSYFARKEIVNIIYRTARAEKLGCVQSCLTRAQQNGQLIIKKYPPVTQ